jgi:long-chain fatty acid transport protein
MPLNSAGLLSRIAMAVGLSAAAMTLQASGFRVPEASIAGLGLSNALVANPDEAGALPYNPAAMGFHEQRQLGVGVILVDPRLRVTPEGGSGEIESDGRSPIAIPNFYYMQPLADAWSLGLHVGAPFGL